MMKNILALMLAVLMILSLLTACGAKTDPPADAAPAEEAGTEAAPAEESAEKEDAEQPAEAPALLPGGWAAADSPALTDEVLDAFSRAVEGLTGVGYEPIACLGRQVVAGTNYAVFCRALGVYPDARPFFAVLHIFAGLDGSAEILDITSFTPAGEPDENAQAAQPVTGGWSVPESDEEGFAALEKAAASLVGAGYRPLCVMGRQLVNGTNYCLLCEITAVAPDAAPHYAFVTVWQSLDGNAEISAVTELDGSGLPA